MTILTRVLNAIGLMTRAEHEAVKRQAVADKKLIEHVRADRAAYDAKLKLAATDLAKQAEEIEANKQDADRVQHMLDESEKLVSALTDKNVELIGKLQTADGKIAGLERRIASLKPDALLWRNAREKRAKNRGGGK